MCRKSFYRLILVAALVVDLLLLGMTYTVNLGNTLPDSMYVHVGDRADFDFPLPIETVVLHNKKVHEDIHYTDTGNYQVDIKLFGLFNIKKVSVDAIEDMEVMPCGQAIGINIEMDGLLVLGTGKVNGADGTVYEPAYQILQTGDYITGVDGKKVSSIDELQHHINLCKKDSITLDVRRNNEESSVNIPVIRCDDNNNRIGVWVREDTQGIGTLTCITKDGLFAALGHGITDTDTGLLLKIKKGEIYNTEVIKIVKGTAGNPGEIMGMILESESEKIGDIEKNTPLGITGTVVTDFPYTFTPIGLRKDIRTGPASILCQLGDDIREYDINIDEVWIGRNDNKGIVLSITDKKLLEKSGGIIQGMSGSPIIQNGKVIGAVTHVFVNDPTRGYGIFIENMLGSR